MSISLPIYQADTFNFEIGFQRTRFSGYMLAFINNLKWLPLRILLFPFTILFLLFLSASIKSLVKRLEKDMPALKMRIRKSSYKETKSLYEQLNPLLEKMSDSLQKFDEGPHGFLSYFLQGFISKSKQLFAQYNELHNTAKSCLYYDMSDVPPLSEKEKETMNRLNDVWGDDEDGIYAEWTHFRLKSNS